MVFSKWLLSFESSVWELLSYLLSGWSQKNVFSHFFGTAAANYQTPHVHCSLLRIILSSTHPKLTVTKLVQASVILYINYGQVSCLGNLCLTSSCSTSYKHMLKSPLFTSKGLGHMAFPVFCSYCHKLIQNKELCIPSSGASSKSWKKWILNV